MRQAYWEDELSILSAENVNFAVETAGLGSRFGAAAIDLTVQLFAVFLVTVAAGVISDYLLALREWSKWAIYAGGALYILIVFLISYAYYFFFEWLWDGQTPGKRALGLRVMQTTGMPITYWHAFVRNLLRIVDFLPFMYGVGAVSALLNEHNRRVGDLVAGTIVARERRDATQRKVLDIAAAVEAFLAAGAPLEPSTATAPTATAPTATTTTATQSTPSAQQTDHSSLITHHSKVDAEAAALRARLDAQDYELTRDFLLRRDKLPSAARQRLGQSLAHRLAAKLSQQLPPPAQNEAFLEAVAATWQRAERE